MFSRSPVSESARARSKSEVTSRIARAATLALVVAGAVAGTGTGIGVISPALAAPAPPVADATAQNPKLQLEANSAGLKTLRYNGVDLLSPKKNITLTRAKVRDANGISEWASDKGVSSFDAATATQTVQYPWGKVSYRYVVQGDRLLVTTMVLNQTAQTIVDMYSRPLVLQVVGGLQSPGRQGNARNIDDLAVVRREFSNPQGGPGGSIFMVSEDVDPTLSLRLGSSAKTSGAVSCGVEWLPIQRTAKDFINADSADIKPGQSKSYTFSLRFRPQSETFEEFSKPLYAERGQQVGTLLNWEDRRPIGSIFAANSNTGYPNNPRGWFNDNRVDINSPQGRASFQERMLKFADGCVNNLKNVGSQGMIFWDLEGEEMPHAITYLGDPRTLPQAAPEMDEIADKFFAKFRKAGLRTGVTLRPSRVVTDPNTGKWRHNHMAFDPVNEISEKISYAQNRWGCTIFYVDSNATYAFDNDGKVTSWTMRAEMFRELERRHPDCLIIPEHETFDYWSATAPYQELRSNSFGTPDLERVAYPGAFSVINIADGDLNRHHDALVEDLKNGDVLLFRCWFDDKTHQPVKNLYEEAKTPAPTVTPEPQPQPEPEPVFESEIIVDNRDAGATYQGEWKVSGASNGFYAQDYRHDLNNGKATKSVRFTPDLPRAGTWQVFARWSSYHNRATNAPYDVNAADATSAKSSATLVFNQRQNGGEWVSLGQYFFNAGTGGNVTLRTNSSNGYVIADAVKWVFVSNAAPAASASMPSVGAAISSASLPSAASS